MRLKVASMFAGIGGICLGFKQAGFDIVWANDIDSDAIKTYKRNFESANVVEGDIRKIAADTLPEFDILTAGFPCQSFSVRGKQLGFKDPRGNLFFEIGRIINAKRPRVVFLENVANHQARRRKDFFSYIQYSCGFRVLCQIRRFGRLQTRQYSPKARTGFYSGVFRRNRL